MYISSPLLTASSPHSFGDSGSLLGFHINWCLFFNPGGTINNSKLELAGSMAHNDILVMTAEAGERTIHNAYNNKAAVFWQPKGAATTTGPPAYLLHLQALHQRQFRYVTKHDYIPGQSNVMVDFLSQAWYLTVVQIVAHFNPHFSQPVPWQKYHLRKPMNSSLILTLSKKRCPM